MKLITKFLNTFSPVQRFVRERSLSITRGGRKILCRGMKINMLNLLGHETLMPYFVGT